MESHEQTEFEGVPKGKTIPYVGGWLIEYPKGSQYKDPDTKKMITRDENVLQVANKATQGKGQKLGRNDLEALASYMASDKGRAFINRLPEVPSIE